MTGEKIRGVDPRQIWAEERISITIYHNSKNTTSTIEEMINSFILLI